MRRFVLLLLFVLGVARSFGGSYQLDHHAFKGWDYVDVFISAPTNAAALGLPNFFTGQIKAGKGLGDVKCFWNYSSGTLTSQQRQWAGSLQVTSPSPCNWYGWVVETDPFLFHFATTVVFQGGTGLGGDMVIYDEELMVAVTDDCPPRENVTFKVSVQIKPKTPDGNRPDSSFRMTLAINGDPVHESGVIPVPAGSGPVDITDSLVVPHVDGGFTWQWLCNGVVVAFGGYDCFQEIPLNIVDAGQVAVTLGDAAPQMNTGGTDSTGNETTSTTTGGSGSGGSNGNATGGTGTEGDTSLPGTAPEPEAAAPGTPARGGTTNAGGTTTTTSTVANGTTTLGGEGTATVQDMYNAIRQGLLDASKTGSSISTTFSPVQVDDFTPDLEASVTGLTDSVDSVRSSGSSLFGSNRLASLPTSWGSGGGFEYFSHGGQTFSVNFAAAGFADGASKIRAAALWLLTVGFAIAVVSTVRAYV